MRYIARTFFVFLFPLLCYSQTTNYSIDAQYDRGEVLLSNDFIAYNNEEQKPLTFYEGASLRLLIQGDGHKNWQRSLNLPYYGFGLSARDFRSNELGQSYSAYGVLGIPIFRFKAVELFSELEYGMAFGWNHYDPISNPYNLAIGSKLTVHAAARLLTKFNIGNHVDLNLGAAFLHFSNGRFERPNNGLNIATLSAGVTVHIKDRINTQYIPDPIQEDRPFSYTVILAHGSHQNEKVLNNKYYNVAGVNLSVAKRHSNLYQSRVGIDANYMWILSDTDDDKTDNPGWGNLTLGLMYQPEVTISKFTLVGGLGIYAKHKEYNPFSKLYQRLGVRYNIVDCISVGYYIRSVNFYQAEFLEFQVGYHF